MFKAVAKTADGRHLLVLGLSAENIRRLQMGQSIYFDCAQLHIPPSETIGHVTIFYGKTEADILRDVRALIGPQTEVLDISRGPKEPQ